jgi:hypothetical protein
VFGLLSETHRKLFVDTVSNYAIQGEDVTALSDSGIQLMFRGDELTTLREQVQMQLIPRLDDIRHEVQVSYRELSDSPEEHMSRYLETLSTLHACYEENHIVVAMIARERLHAELWISENEQEETEQHIRRVGADHIAPIKQSARSIFDDIDT